MKTKFYFLLGLILFTNPLFATGAISAQIGGLHFLRESSDKSPHLDFMGYYYYAWDQMVFLGLGGGFQQIGSEKSAPIVTSLSIRLPLGSVILPTASADWGYALGSQKEFIWRAAGGFDLKLGDQSSIVGLCGLQNYFNSEIKSPLFWRTGLLLEF